MTQLKKALHFSLALYLIAACVSIAGMEVFGWLTFVLVVATAISSKDKSPWALQELRTVLPWKALTALFAVTVIGVFLNATPEVDKAFVIGKMRWMLILTSLTLAFSLIPLPERLFKPFVALASVIAVYAIFQHFTGIDLIRSGNRAVQALNTGGETLTYRSAGTFSSPMSYVYIAGMYLCLPLAVFMSYPKERRNIRVIALFAVALIGASIVTTLVRGAWLAVGVASLAMAALVSWRLLASVLAAGAATFAALYFSVTSFQFRINSLFDFNYHSNSDRLTLWQANWEMFKDYPFLGVGYGVNEARVGEYIAKMGISDAFKGHAHSNYLQFLAGTGILGFAAYIFIICFFLFLSYRLWNTLPKEMIWARALALATFGAQVALHIGGITECNFKDGETNHMIMIIFATVASLTLLQRKNLLSRLSSSKS